MSEGTTSSAVSNVLSKSSSNRGNPGGYEDTNCAGLAEGSEGLDCGKAGADRGGLQAARGFQKPCWHQGDKE
ncbi:hypothetical protein MHYP_G00206560 [Metynnis hypsauchen]